MGGQRQLAVSMTPSGNLFSMLSSRRWVGLLMMDLLCISMSYCIRVVEIHSFACNIYENEQKKRKVHELVLALWTRSSSGGWYQQISTPAHVLDSGMST